MYKAKAYDKFTMLTLIELEIIPNLILLKITSGK